MAALIQESQVVRSARVAGDIVFVDGLTRSGKGLLGPILSAFERVEIERVEPSFEWVGAMAQLGKLSRDGAVALLRMLADEFLFNSMVGRNANFRWEDHSSVWHNPQPWVYFRRLFLPERDAALARIRLERPIFQNMTHRQLPNFRLLREAFGDGLRMVEMVRHPVDLVDSWMRKRKGERIGSDPQINVVCIDYRGHSLPYYVMGREEEFLAATPLGRVVLMLSIKFALSRDALSVLDAEERRRLFLIPLDGFLETPEPHLESLAAFLGTRPTRRMARILRRERVPRRLDRSARRERRRRIEAEATPAEREMLERLISDYEELEREIGR